MMRYYVNKAGKGGTHPWLVWRSEDGGEWQLAIHRGFESWRTAYTYACIALRAAAIRLDSDPNGWKLFVNSTYGKS